MCVCTPHLLGELLFGWRSPQPTTARHHNAIKRPWSKSGMEWNGEGREAIAIAIHGRDTIPAHRGGGQEERKEEKPLQSKKKKKKSKRQRQRCQGCVKMQWRARSMKSPSIHQNYVRLEPIFTPPRCTRVSILCAHDSR